MAAEDLNIGGLKTLQDLVERTPSGKAAVSLAARLGLWTTRAHSGAIERPMFTSDLSTLTHDRLSRELGYWTSELGRILELNGFLVGQENALKIETRAAQARARARIRRDRETQDLKPLSVSDLKDSADDDPTVVDLLERGAVLAIVMASTQAAKDATVQYIASVSREIAFRDSQIRGKMYS